MPDPVPGAERAPDDEATPAPGHGLRTRLRSSLSTPSRRQLVVAVLLALVGFAAVTQVRVAGTDDSYSGLRQQDLIDVLTALSGTRQRAEADIARLEGVRDDLLDDTTKRQAALDQAQKEVDDLSVLAGLVPVSGPGIRITITEQDGTVRLSSMLDTVQELRTVGAEAMQFNGEVRVVAQTAFSVTSAGFEIDGSPVEAPYVIDVIGDPATLQGAMTFALGPKQQLERDGATVAVDQLSSIDIESVHDDAPTDFAEPGGDQ